MFNLQHIASGERSQLVNQYALARAQYLEYLRRAILIDNRIDLLATVVLGYELKAFHRQMLEIQDLYPNNLQLVFRGAGKSTICTVVRAIFLLCKWPKIRFVISSKTIKQSRARLKEITSHLVGNDLLIELFGEFYNPKLWNATEIEISQRHDPKHKDSPGAAASDATPSIVCIGAKGSIAGAHFDGDFCDDLIDKTNSHSELTREEVKEWFASTFSPMIDPPDPDIPFRGFHHRVGTRYHYLDLYGSWIKSARAAHDAGSPVERRMYINVIPCYDYLDTRNDKYFGLGLGVYSGRGTGQSPWPERWTVEELLSRRSNLGHLAFSAQYWNDVSEMDGEIFDYDDFIEVEEREAKKLYSNMTFFIGCDLAISLRTTADDSAFVVVGKFGRGKDTDYYIVDVVNGRLRFGQQTKEIKRLHDKWNKVGAGVKKIGVESVQYQQAQYQHLQDTYPHLKPKLKKISPRKGDDKVSRAHRRAPLLQAGHIKLVTKPRKVAGEFVTTAVGWQVREQMVRFPSGEHDDLFDALDHAISANEKTSRKKRGREKEVGVL